MSALARFFYKQGVTVSGYDRTKTELTEQLASEGIRVYYDEDTGKIPATVELAVYTPAIPASHILLRHCKEANIPLIKRAEMLGNIAALRKTVAVAGTHGKTTTASMIAHILCMAGSDAVGFIGGIAGNYGSNLITAGRWEQADACFVVEADEYDRSFLHLRPAMAVITATDADHLDIYHDKGAMQEAFVRFASQVGEGGLLVKKGINMHLPAETYALEDDADHRAGNIQVANGRFVFDYHGNGISIKGIELNMPGRHNVENAVAACALALKLGVHEEAIRTAMDTYSGVKRRFEYVINTPGMVFIDDYAHHPVEIESCLRAVRELYPGRKITAIFQPHLYTRTRDFYTEFAASLSRLHRLILLPIYPAREEPLAGVSSRLILDIVDIQNKILCEKEELLDALDADRPDILLTIGAGDIDALVKPIRDYLMKE